MDKTYIAQNSSGEQLVCDLSAMPPNDRLQYRDLRLQLHAALISSRAMSDGYALQLNEERISMEAVSQWIRLESLCCPWLSLRGRRVKPGTVEVRLKATQRAKQVLRMELGELLVK